jgi:ankyrin repeat protein
MVSLFVGAGADVNAADTEGSTVIIEAVRSGSTEITAFLLDKGALPEVQEMHGQNAFHEAVLQGNLEMVTLIRQAGANPLTRDTRGRTPLSLAFSRGDPFILGVLGDDRRLVDTEGNTPLHVGVAEGVGADTLGLLIGLGYPVNRRNRFGETALTTAIKARNDAAVTLLLEQGSDPYLLDNAGESAVTAALKQRSASLTNLVRLAGSRTDIRGDGLLHYAAQVADRDTIQRLLALGLDKTQRNTAGETPYDVALRWQKAEVARLLQ